MRIEIATIGDEVLSGDVINTNGAFLSRELSARGYEVSRHSVLPDESQALLQGLKEAMNRSTLVVASGGLGSTMDDLTKQISTRLFHTHLQRDSALYDELHERLGEGSTLKEQSRVPHEAIVLRNKMGSAPGFLFLSAEGSLLLLPGSPHEMEQMFKNEAIPLLAEHFPPDAKTKTLRINICQKKESDLDPILHEIQEKNTDVKIGVYPDFAMMKLQFTVSKNFERLDKWGSQIRQAFSEHVLDHPTLQESVRHAFLHQKKTIALAESCTGGALSARLVSLPDASKYLLGSLVVYSNEWKESFLHVQRQTLAQDGPVSRAVAQEMAQGLLKSTKADYALAISGIAGPSGGSKATPVGTMFLAIGDREGIIDAGRVNAPPERTSAIEFAVQFALGSLWRRLTFHKLTFS